MLKTVLLNVYVETGKQEFKKITALIELEIFCNIINVILMHPC